MKQYYECHITMITDFPTLLEIMCTTGSWKFSKIDGDPVLGAGIKCHATIQYNKRKLIHNILSDMDIEASFLKRHGKATILRKKIELVIRDERLKA